MPRYTAAQLALRYGFPTLTEPTKQYVAIIELTSKEAPTGWSENDFKAYCAQVNKRPSPLCKVGPTTDSSLSCPCPDPTRALDT